MLLSAIIVAILLKGQNALSTTIIISKHIIMYPVVVSVNYIKF